VRTVGGCRALLGQGKEDSNVVEVDFGEVRVFTGFLDSVRPGRCKVPSAPL
jgi:hypothetical protein